MPRSLCIVTGSSRGLGAAMVEHLVSPDRVVLGIARRESEALAKHATARAGNFEQWPRDLADPLPVVAELERWLASQQADAFDEAVLVNNAAMLGHVGPVDEGEPAAVSAALRVGLEATILLTGTFLRATRGWRARRKVLNISSGLGRRAMAGSSVYCAIKAGMDLFSAAVALDERHRGRDGARIVSLAPGVIDTDMQQQLRSAEATGFPEQERFVAMKQGGQLSGPTEAAARVLAYLARPDFGETPIADVRDA